MKCAPTMHNSIALHTPAYLKTIFSSPALADPFTAMKPDSESVVMLCIVSISAQ
jgi:hypothetical protein